MDKNFKYFYNICFDGESMFKIVLSSGRPFATTTGRAYYFKTRAEAKKKIKRLGARGRGARIVHVNIKHRVANKGAQAGHRIKRSKGRKSRAKKTRGRKRKAGRPKKRGSRKGRKSSKRTRRSRSRRHHKVGTWRRDRASESPFFM